ncbi:GGDEF domain-containing protein [Neobacillus sp. Marseille-QA0830]
MVTMVKVGVIGPTWIRESLERCFEQFPSLQPIFRLSDRLIDSKEFVRTLQDEVDCLFFSGRIPYLVAKNEIPGHLSSHYIPLKGAGLYQALYRLGKKRDIQYVSFDGLQQRHVELVKKSLEETFQFDLYDRTISIEDLDEIVNFHVQNTAEHPDGVVITSIKIVSERLTAQGILNEWLKPSEEDMIVSLERLLLATTQRQQKETQIVFGRIQIDNPSSLFKEFDTEHQLQKRNQDVYRMFLDFAEQIEGYLTAISGNEYLFVTQRGTFERVTEGYKYLPLLEVAKHRLNMNLSIGIGFGTTPIEAGSHARLALFQAVDQGGGCSFIVREDRSVFGPIDLVTPVKYHLSVTDKLMLQQAEETGMNATHLEKTIAMMKRKGHSSFTAQEMAGILGITTRSAHRIVQSWLDTGLIHVVGMEKITRRGRPRQIFAFKNGGDVD